VPKKSAIVLKELQAYRQRLLLANKLFVSGLKSYAVVHGNPTDVKRGTKPNCKENLGGHISLTASASSKVPEVPEDLGSKFYQNSDGYNQTE
jgi:hypothetical protein